MDKQILRHTLFWLIYTLILTYLNATGSVTAFEIFPKSVANIFINQLTIQLIFTLAKIPFAYIILFLVKKFLDRKIKLLSVLLFTLFVLCIGSIILSIVNHTFIQPYLLSVEDNEYSVFSTGSLLYHFLSLIFVIGFGIGLELIIWRYKTELKLAQLNSELRETELKYLKSQINPHFLFNTLNNIYSLARKKSDLTSDAVLKLSKLLRFVIYEANQPTIKLSEELIQIQAFIDLEKMRYAKPLSITFTTSIDDVHAEIAPLLLINFVENSFKHGVSEMKSESFVKIDIELKNKTLKAEIINSYAGEINVEKNKIGMENIKRQLALVYPNHILEISANHNIYGVKLILTLHD